MAPETPLVDRAPDGAAPDVVPTVAVQGLSKRLGPVMAVDDLDLVVRPGQIMGLAGPNGAGKSVTLKILLGLVRPDSGRAELFGEPAGPGAAVLRRVGALVDGPGFVPHLSGLENLRLAWRTAGRRPDQAVLDEAIEVAGLGEAIGRKYRTYSHGMRYRLGLAQATLGRPDLLLLDEPTTGQDPEHVLAVRQVIESAVDRGATVLFSSHELTEVERICTHVAVMRQGKLVLGGPLTEVLGGRRSLEEAYFDAVEGSTPAANARP